MADILRAIYTSIARKTDVSRESYVEGVGNEVLISVGASLAVFIPILISVFVKRSYGVHIHPEEAEHVQAARETLGVAENAENNESNAVTPPRNINDGEPCPICLMPPQYLIVTNCGHGFCGKLCTLEFLTSFGEFRSSNTKSCYISVMKTKALCLFVSELIWLVNFSHQQIFYIHHNF